MTTLHLTKSIGRQPLRRGVLLVPLALACFALSPTPNAFGVSPAPDGGYPNGNTAEGFNPLFHLTSGIYNTAIGFDALFYNTTGGYNTANGASALAFNTTGNYNTANGNQALFRNTTGSDNTANGFQALASNTTGNDDTANGFGALFHNTTGFRNTANGADALFYNTTGSRNTAEGRTALYSNTTGGSNIAVGNGALNSNTTGGSNTALGNAAGYNLTTGSNNIDIGNLGVAGQANTIHIGNAVATVYPDGTTHPAQTATFIAGIHGATASGGVAVFVNSSGQLGTLTSSARFKEAIKPMDKASEAILALKPVTFRYKKDLDPDGIPQFGLVAEEVEKVSPDLVARDAEGKVYTVRYEAVNAMLLNEFLKAHRKAQQQQAAITELKSAMVQQRKDFEATTALQQKEIQVLTASLKEQAAQIQKVKARLEVSKAAPQTVLNNQ